MRRYLTPRWMLKHLAMLIAVAGCLVLGRWQFGRAAQGNALSIGYAVEWPVFALFAVFVWAREIRLARRADRPAEPVARAPVDPLAIAVPVPHRTAGRPPEDTDLGAYNAYLAWLNENPDRRPAEYPGR